METAEPAALVPLRTLETSCAMDSSSSASAARRAERRRRASMRDMAPRGRGQAAGAPVMTSPRACRCNRDCGNGLSQVRVASKAGGRPETEKLESRDRRASGHGTGTKQHRRAKHDSRHPAKARFPIPVPPEEQSLASKRGPDALFVARSQE